MIIKEEDCVSFAVAKLLKDKGYNEKCWGLYTTIFDDEDNQKVVFGRWTVTPHNNSFKDEFFVCSAPTRQRAMEWLKKKNRKKRLLKTMLKVLRYPFSI
jgi:hypothetical protein